MSGLSGTAEFRTLAAETTEALKDRGLDVMPLVVDELLESGAQRLAEQLGVFTDRDWPKWVPDLRRCGAYMFATESQVAQFPGS